jgi:hypothetical protein
MVMLDGALVVVVLGIVVYGIAFALLRPQEQRHPASLSGTWRVAHYDTKQETHVVLQKIAEGGSQVLDEHVVATFRSDDPDYDDLFLTAMNTARHRQALFESEDGS